MNLSVVKSSYLKEIGYDPDKQELEVTFNSGAKFSYFDVSQTAYDSLITAESVGKHFATNIKGQYAHKKHEPEEEKGA